MKIYIISPTENILTMRGNRHPFLANEIIKNGHEIIYFSSNFYHAEKRKFSKKEIQESKSKFVNYFIDVPGYKTNLSIMRFITHIVFSIKVFFSLLLKEKADIIIIPSRPPELIFAINILRLIKKTTVIIDVRDVWPDAFPGGGFKKLMFSFYCNIFQYTSLPFLSNYVYTSPMFLKWIERYRRKKKMTLFVTLGFDESRWKNIKKIHSIEKVIKIVYIGNIAQTMNFNPLIEGLLRNEHYFLHIIGEGDGIEKIKEIIRKKNIKNIELRGYIEKEKIPEILKEYHISVIPMVKGTLPNKLFDSIASNIPVLAFGENDTTKFVNENGIGWSVPFDNNEVDKFLKNLSKKEIFEKSQSIAKIRYKYSKEYLYKEYIRFIESIIR